MNGGKNCFSFDQLVGRNEAMRALIEKIKVIAQYDVSVLIEGESGTGKELVARAIHYNSPRKEKEFVVINCSAFSDSLLESELFGYVKGSFTGALTEKEGLFEVADRGTFFLDEVGDMSPALQVKILRVLQEGTFFKVGGTRPIKVDVRIVAATNKNLGLLVEQKKFREDLYYRVNVVNLPIPPLRERKEDIDALTDHILAKVALKNREAKKEVSAEVLEIFKRYDWPGNVRELENELEKAVIFSANKSVIMPANLSQELLRHVRDFKRDVLQEKPGMFSLKDLKRMAVEEIERDTIRRGLEKSNWNKTLCAKLLGVSRIDLMRKISKYQIKKP